jgi:DNA-binding transcriptional ArsR family regulator
VLREHDLVKVEHAGRLRVYSLYDEHVAALLEQAQRHIEQRGKTGLRARKAAEGRAHR